MSNCPDCGRESSYRCPNLVYSRSDNGTNDLTTASIRSGGKRPDEVAVCGTKLDPEELSGRPPQKSKICPLYKK